MAGLALILAIAGNGLTFVVLGTVAFSLLMSVLFLVTRGSDSLYDQIGQGGLSKESDYEAMDGHGLSGPGGLSGGSAGGEEEREIRQLLRARNERLLRRGQPPLDVEAELQRLLSAGDRDPDRKGEHDPALVAEVRQLVQARNERRQRQGLEPLDEEAEVTRTLDELDP